MTSLANAFDPSSAAACADGPKQAMPRSRTASATPATSGASGPTTTRSTPSVCASVGHRRAVERVDGVQRRRPRRCPGCRGRRAPRRPRGHAQSASARACSRPPPPTTSTFTRRPAARSTARVRGRPRRPERRAGHLLERPHVGLRVRRQVVEGAAPGDVLLPAVEELVDRLGVVELRLRHRHLVVAHAVDLVAHAHRDPLPPAEHVELGQEELGQPVDPGGVARDHRVVPATAALPPGGGAELPPIVAQPVAVVVEELGREGSRADPRRVGLDDPDDPVDPRRTDAGTGQTPPASGLTM